MSIAVININSDITTYIASAPVIAATTPALVSLAKSIASSQDLADKVAAFVGLDGSTDDSSNSSSSNGDGSSADGTSNEVSTMTGSTAGHTTQPSRSSGAFAGSALVISLLSSAIGHLFVSGVA